jgi:hypothetical protein
MPCTPTAGGQAKEGFSVFGSLNKCVSPQGRRLLRLWFCRPIVNLQVGAGGCWRVLVGGWLAGRVGGLQRMCHLLQGGS